MKFYGMYPGIVIQNNDPEKAGRVKVYVNGITNVVYDGWNAVISDKSFSFINGDLNPILQELRDALPWAQNVSPVFGGGCDMLAMGNDATGLARPSGTFSIPNVGATTYVFFIGGDVNCPAFFGINHGAKAWQAVMGSSYPSTYENKGTGTYVSKHVINTNKHYIELIDDDGDESINIFSAGNRNCTVALDDTLTIGGNCDITIEGNVTLNVTGDITATVLGNITSTATGVITITGSQVNIN